MELLRGGRGVKQKLEWHGSQLVYFPAFLFCQAQNFTVVQNNYWDLESKDRRELMRHSSSFASVLLVTVPQAHTDYGFPRNIACTSCNKFFFPKTTMVIMFYLLYYKTVFFFPLKGESLKAGCLWLSSERFSVLSENTAWRWWALTGWLGNLAAQTQWSCDGDRVGAAGTRPTFMHSQPLQCSWHAEV